MTHSTEIREVSRADRDALLRMYRTFDPLGVAQGLPPRSEEARQEWIDRALAEEFNWGAFTAAGDAAGHVFLAGSAPREVELAAFVHQGFRQRRIGTALVKAALARAARDQMRRVWALVSTDNLPALRLLKRCGFRSARLTFPTVELELNFDE